MLALIVAYSKNRVIGNKGKIPWKIPGEQIRFKKLTTGNVVIMGRKTFESIGYPLPNRYTIVISNTANYYTDNCTTTTSLGNALELATDMECDCFIAGGEQLYREAIPLVHKMYITEIGIEIKGDSFFPEFDERLFRKHVDCENKDIPYTCLTYTRY